MRNIYHQIKSNINENKEDWYYLCNDAEQALFKVKNACKDETAIKSLERMILDLNNIRMEQYERLTEYSLNEDFWNDAGEKEYKGIKISVEKSDKGKTCYIPLKNNELSFIPEPGIQFFNFKEIKDYIDNKLNEDNDIKVGDTITFYSTGYKDNGKFSNKKDILMTSKVTKVNPDESVSCTDPQGVKSFDYISRDEILSVNNKKLNEESLPIPRITKEDIQKLDKLGEDLDPRLKEVIDRFTSLNERTAFIGNREWLYRVFAKNHEGKDESESIRKNIDKAFDESVLRDIQAFSRQYHPYGRELGFYIIYKNNILEVCVYNSGVYSGSYIPEVMINNAFGNKSETFLSKDLRGSKVTEDELSKSLLPLPEDTLTPKIEKCRSMLFEPEQLFLDLKESVEDTLKVETCVAEDTGGHVIVCYGKLANGNYYAISDDILNIYDTDIHEYEYNEENFEETDGDFTSYENEHKVEEYYYDDPSYEEVLKQCLKLNKTARFLVREDDKYKYLDELTLEESLNESTDNLNIEHATPNYTGGGVYAYTGKLSDGTYFMAGDDWFDKDHKYFSVRIVNENPDEAGDNGNDAWFEDWQKPRLVRDLSLKECKEFTKQLLEWIINNKPEGNYDIGDMENLLAVINNGTINEDSYHEGNFEGNSVKVDLHNDKKNSEWIVGDITINGNTYRVNAKTYMIGSEFGIDNGPVSKLYIADADDNTIVNYDRGWDIKPNEENKEIYNIILGAVKSYRNNNPYEVDPDPRLKELLLKKEEIYNKALAGEIEENVFYDMQEDIDNQIANEFSQEEIDFTEKLLGITHDEDAVINEDADINENAYVICYNDIEVWSNRNDAKNFYEDGAAFSEGAEQQRYANIAFALYKGNNFADDGGNEKVTAIVKRDKDGKIISEEPCEPMTHEDAFNYVSNKYLNESSIPELPKTLTKYLDTDKGMEDFPTVEKDGTKWFSISQEDYDTLKNYVDIVDSIPEDTWKSLDDNTSMTISNRANNAERVCKNSIIKESYENNKVQEKTVTLSDGTRVKFITYKNEDGTYHLNVMSNYENLDEFCGDFKNLSDLDNYIDTLITSDTSDDEKLYYVNYIKESSYPNFDLPEGYPQEVYDKYFEYTKDFDLVDEEPLDFNEWVIENKITKEN